MSPQGVSHRVIRLHNILTVPLHCESLLTQSSKRDSMSCYRGFAFIQAVNMMKVGFIYARETKPLTQGTSENSSSKV